MSTGENIKRIRNIRGITQKERRKNLEWQWGLEKKVQDREWHSTKLENVLQKKKC